MIQKVYCYFFKFKHERVTSRSLLFSCKGGGGGGRLGGALDLRNYLCKKKDYHILYICMKAIAHKVSSIGFLHKTHLANFTIFMSDIQKSLMFYWQT